MIRKFLLAIGLLGALAGVAFGQEAVEWMTFEQAVDKLKDQPREVFVDVYTDWCGWCKVMDKNTFSDPRVAKLLNEEFYPVKFNAEQHEDVIVNGTTFKFVPSGANGYHELAAALLNNQLSYPTGVFIDESFKKVYPMPGYRQPEEFYKLLAFFAGDYQNGGDKAWEEFEKAYKSPYLNN